MSENSKKKSAAKNGVAQNHQDIVENLRRFRKTKQLTQTKLSKISGLPQSTISKIELKMIDPSTKTIFKLITALNLELLLRDRS